MNTRRVGALCSLGIALFFSLITAGLPDTKTQITKKESVEFGLSGKPNPDLKVKLRTKTTGESIILDKTKSERNITFEEKKKQVEAARQSLHESVKKRQVREKVKPETISYKKLARNKNINTKQSLKEEILKRLFITQKETYVSVPELNKEKIKEGQKKVLEEQKEETRERDVSISPQEIWEQKLKKIKEKIKDTSTITVITSSPEEIKRGNRMQELIEKGIKARNEQRWDDALNIFQQLNEEFRGDPITAYAQKHIEEIQEIKKEIIEKVKQRPSAETESPVLPEVSKSK